jgi:hypothetical protein
MPRGAWSKGKTYTMASKRVYANKGSWNAAMRRMHADLCMRCGWDEGPCDTHHILAKANGGPMSLDNGVILCPNCHRLADKGLISTEELHALKDAAPVRGERAGGDANGSPGEVDLLAGGFPSRAKTSASQDGGQDSQVNEADSSTPSPMQLTLGSDPEDGFSLRTYLDSFHQTVDEISPSYSRRWPSSGFTTSPGECWTADTSECPSEGAVSSSLPDVLEADVHPRFSLSPKAAAGILRRAEKRGKALPGALQTALQWLAASQPPSDGTGKQRTSSPKPSRQTEDTGREPTTTPTSPTPSEQKASMDQRTARAAVRRLSPTECERLQGFPDGWTVVLSPPRSHEATESSPIPQIGMTARPTSSSEGKAA